MGHVRAQALHQAAGLPPPQPFVHPQNTHTRVHPVRIPAGPTALCRLAQDQRDLVVFGLRIGQLDGVPLAAGKAAGQQQVDDAHEEGWLDAGVTQRRHRVATPR